MENGYLKAPETTSEWKKVACDFERKWNFPNCLGSIDGKHVVMQAPARLVSSFFNYKKFHSIVLLAVVNSNYEFIMVDIGDSGRQSDGGAFAASKLGYAMEHNLLHLTELRQLGNSNKAFQYVFVGDEAFPLKTYMIKLYPRTSLGEKERIANYQISRARRQVENVFGICASRFRIFRRPIIAQVDTVVAVTKAVVGLHNLLMFGRSFENCPVDYNLPQNEKDKNERFDNEINRGLVPLSQTG